MAQKRYFVTKIDGHKGLLSWCLEGNTATRVGVPNAMEVENANVRIEPSQPLEAQFRRALPTYTNLSLFEKPLAPGKHYSRIARPIDQNPEDFGLIPNFAAYKKEVGEAQGQLVSLTNKLNRICEVVEPDPANLSCFGHSLRECLLIAATEVETHWKAVLQSNGYATKHYSTADYVKTLPAMKLAEYEVSFPLFPKLPTFRPFKDWSAERPTQSLPFYDAYNKVKHDRENKFDFAKLQFVIEAVSACAVMAIAQFGYSMVIPKRRALSEFFQITKIPSWLPEELYTSAAEGWHSGEVNYNFN